MLRITTILLTLFYSSYLLAQKQSYFRNADFREVELDDSYIIVKYRQHSIPSSNQSIRLLEQSKAANHPSVLDGVMKVRLKEGESPIDACNRLMRDPNVIYADPVILDYPLVYPSDPLLSSQYYLDNIKAKAAWDITTGDDDITIGIIDTGVDLDHEDLISNLWTNENDPIDGIDNDGNGYVDDYWGYDFADNDPTPEADQNPHGARVAGVAGASANNGLGIAGVGFNTKIAALKGFSSSNGFSSGLFDAILYGVENGIQVLNLSWGSIRQPLQSEQDIINYAVLEKNVVIVAAAGNDGNKSTAEEKFYPASYDNVLSVGGSDASDSKWSGSSYNYAVDLIAPASSILSTTSGNSYNSTGGFGTSFASPMVAAAAALVKDQFPHLSAQQIMERVRVSADDIYGIGNNYLYEGKLGKGRLNILRAVSENNLKSLRASNTVSNTSRGPNVFYGDTVTVTTQLTSFLNPINDLGLYISSPVGNFQPNTESLFPGLISSADSKEISFQIVLSESLQPESKIAIRLDFIDASYSDFQFIEITTAPDYVNFGNETIQMTLSGNGDMGLLDYGFDEKGVGLRYQGDSLAQYTGIMLGTSETSMLNNIVSNYNTPERSNGFNARKNYKLYHHPGVDLYGYSEFIDPINNLIIEQSNLVWEDEDFLIVRYRIINNNASAINGLSFGVFTDWDLGDPLTNYAAFDIANDYLYARNNNANLYAATKVLGAGTSTYSVLDRSDQNGNAQDIEDNFTNASKYDYLVNQFIPEAGNVGAGNDVAGIHGITLNQLAAYEATYVDLIYAASNSQLNLELTLANAQSHLNQFLQKPRVLETFYTCDGVSVSLDPSQGTNYEFYEDPLASTLITTGSSFNPGTVSSDTSFYVRNVDQNYASDIYELRLKLLNEIADFEFSTDTLYLDHPTTNTVLFTDTSLDAIAWEWNFGQGSQSTIQHSSMVYDSPGTYTVTLSIENSQGCSDTIVKELVVANRPDALAFPDYTICPETLLTITNAQSSKLHIYADQNSATPIISGSELQVGPFSSDSIIYVSGHIEGLESNRTPVNVFIFDIEADFLIVPDTLSESHQLRFISQVEESSVIEWMVDGTSQGNEKELVLPATTGTRTIELLVQSEEGCTITVAKTFKTSTSPFASISDITACVGESALIQPANGMYFGFYEDAGLTALISKGKQMVVNESQTVYVVGLDDGLPGMPVEVNVTFEAFEVGIEYEVSKVGNKNKVILSTLSESPISSYKWYVDGELASTSSSPILFFEDSVTAITLETLNDNGCFASDGISFDFTPPLGHSSDNGISIYPNPATNFITIQTDEVMKGVSVKDMAGKLIHEMKIFNNTLDISHLQSGLYLLEAYGDDETYKMKMLVK